MQCAASIPLPAELPTMLQSATMSTADMHVCLARSMLRLLHHCPGLQQFWGLQAFLNLLNHEVGPTSQKLIWHDVAFHVASWPNNLCHHQQYALSCRSQMSDGALWRLYAL